MYPGVALSVAIAGAGFFNTCRAISSAFRRDSPPQNSIMAARSSNASVSTHHSVTAMQAALRFLR